MVVRNYRKVRKNKKYYKKRAYKKKFQPKKHYFTETFKTSQMAVSYDNTGSTGLVGQRWVAKMDDIPQFAQYKALYQKYRIRRLQWIICPFWGSPEINQAEYNTGTAALADTSLTLHYRKVWATALNPPSSEIDMLQYNGVKTINLKNTVKRISMSNPTTQDGILQVQNATTSMYLHQKNRWCSFDDPAMLEHGGLLTYVVTNSTGILAQQGISIARVYCKVSFEVASPR